MVTAYSTMLLCSAIQTETPYEPSDIYWTMLHIADKAITSHGARRYYQGYVPNIEADTDNDGNIDTSDLFDIMYECALRGAGLKK